MYAQTCSCLILLLLVPHFQFLHRKVTKPTQINTLTSTVYRHSTDNKSGFLVRDSRLSVPASAGSLVRPRAGAARARGGRQHARARAHAARARRARVRPARVRARRPARQRQHRRSHRAVGLVQVSINLLTVNLLITTVTKKTLMVHGNSIYQ